VQPPDDRGLSFEEARARLKERGYLDAGVEGAVLKGALAARGRVRALLQGAAVGAALLAAAFAGVEDVLLSVSSSLSVPDALVLFLWLLAGSLVAASLGVAVLVLLAWLRTRSRGEAEGLSTELAIAFGVLAGLGAAAAAPPALRDAGPLAAMAILVAVAFAVLVAVKVARGVAFTVLLAAGREVRARAPHRRRWALAAAGALFALAAALLAISRARPAPEAEPLITAANGRRALVIGVDGWSDRYGAAGLPAGAALTYDKVGERDPAAFWTSVATGEPPRRHGIGALDLVRVRGVGSPLEPSGASRWFLSRLLPALGLARRESVTAAARRVPAMWEVARRGGIPSLVVNWWTTYPADDSGGTVLSNHLFFAARAGRPLAGEGWPPEAAERAAALAPRVAPEPGSTHRLLADAQGLDAFAIRAFRDAKARERPSLSLLYLPGLDILGAALSEEGRSAAERVTLATALTEEAGRIAAFLKETLTSGGEDFVVVLLDGGRREQSGQVRLFGPLVKPGAGGAIAPLDVAPTVLSLLGVPASRELAGRVRRDLLTEGAASTATIASWGRRRAARELSVDPKEYVENLKSLGYLR